MVPVAEVRRSVLLDEIRIEREGIVVGWAPLVSVATHLLLIALAFWLSELSLRHHPSSEKPTFQITFERIPDLRGEHPGGNGIPSRAGGGSPREPSRPRSVLRRALSPEPSASPPPQAEQRIAEDENGSPVPRASAPPVDRDRLSSLSLERALRDFRHSLGTSGGGSGGGEGAGSPGGLSIPDLPPLPDTGFGFGNLEFESRDYDWSDYARQVYVAIWRAWHNRLYLSTDGFERWGHESLVSLLDHQNRVRFNIAANGQVTGVTLETPSGCVPLDDSALDALHEVILPPLPSDFPRQTETIHARFIAYGEIRAMRGHLKYLRSQGFF